MTDQKLQDRLKYIDALDAGRAARAELRRNMIDIETLYTLRLLCGWQEIIAEKLGEETWQSINAMTSCCDFDFIPSREKISTLDPEELWIREKELIAYLLECNINQILEDVAALAD